MTLTRQMRLSCVAPNNAHPIAIASRHGSAVFATIVANYPPPPLGELTYARGRCPCICAERTTQRWFSSALCAKCTSEEPRLEDLEQDLLAANLVIQFHDPAVYPLQHKLNDLRITKIETHKRQCHRPLPPPPHTHLHLLINLAMFTM